MIQDRSLSDQRIRNGISSGDCRAPRRSAGVLLAVATVLVFGDLAVRAATIQGRIPGVVNQRVFLTQPPSSAIVATNFTTPVGFYSFFLPDGVPYEVIPDTASGLNFNPSTIRGTAFAGGDLLPEITASLNVSGRIIGGSFGGSVELRVPGVPYNTVQMGPLIATNATYSSLNFNSTVLGLAGSPVDNFHLEATTIFTPTNSGNYIFNLTSDDGSSLEIGPASGALAGVVSNNDGQHGSQTRSGIIFLVQDVAYQMRVRYFEASGTANLRLTWQKVAAANFPTTFPEAVFVSTNHFAMRIFDSSIAVQRTGATSFNGAFQISHIFTANQVPLTVPFAGATLTATSPGVTLAPTSYGVTGGGTNYNFTITSSSPTISDVSNRTIAEEASLVVPFTVSDLQTPAASLTVTATSGNSALVDANGLQLGGSAGSRTVTLTPKPNAFGSTLITLVVRDGENRTASDSFTLTVTNVNDGPIAGPKHALAFDGVDDQVVAPALALTNTSFTVEAWARRAELGTWDILAWQGTNQPNRGLHVGFRDNNRFTLGFWNNDLDTEPQLDTDWHHWAASYDAATGLRKIYRDGLLIAQDISTNAFGGISAFVLGRSPLITSSFFQGALDDVRVWSVARTAAEIVGKRFEPLVGNESGLLAYWRLDEAGSIVARDSANKGKDGALTYPNGPAWITRTNNEPAGWNVRAVSENSTDWPVYLAGYDVDSATFTYTITSLTTGVLNRVTGLVTNGLHNPVLYTPPPFYSGEVSFTLVVSDGQFSDTNAVLLSVQGLNDPPLISEIADQVVLEDGVLGPLGFQVSDPDNSADSLIVSARTGDSNLVPPSGLALSGTGTNRTLTVTPAAGESGTLEIVLTAYDGFLSSERRFSVRVEPRPAYKIIDLGALPNRPVSFGAALNDVGAALADAAQNASGQSRRAFVFQGLESGGSSVEVGTLSGTTSHGAGLNNAGDVIGTSPDAIGSSHAFLRRGASGAIVDLGTLVGGTTTFGTALNDDGVAAGYGTVAGGFFRGFLFTNGPSLRQLNPLATHAESAQAFGLNISNLIVGASYDAAGHGQATLWTAATTNALGFLPGGNHSVAYAINRFGLIAGVGNTASGTGLVQRAFLGSGGILTDLGTLPGGAASEARALNNFGQVVGTATVSNDLRAVLYSAGQLYDLNNVIPEEDQVVWRLASAEAINARGEIVGSGFLNGVPRAFLAIPANVIGRRVTRPAGTVAGVAPRIDLLQAQAGDTPQNSFHFSPATGKLYAIRPVTARVKWPTSTNPLDTNAPPVSVLSVNVWPRTPQTHIAGAPVEAEPAVAGFAYAVQALSHTTSPGANLDSGSKVFSAVQPGYSVLYYLQNEGQAVNPQTQPPYFEVVRTFVWNDPRVLPPSADNVAVDIGERVSSPFHRDHPGRNGWMHFEKAFYDGAGAERAYDRATRTGPIIPVNRDTASPNDDFVVVWYATNAIRVSWAYQPVRYAPRWPASPSEIVVASTLGSGELDFFSYGLALRVYNQPDRTLPGFNPNEEHALLAPANGGAGQALFALRDDLNRFNNYSEPYALLKYRDPADGDWRIQPFRVVETTPQYPFRYSGVAGNEIAPPYPLSILTLCDNSHGVSGPYWEDYNGKLYARAAGFGAELTANVVARWWYPLQPTFFYDLDGNGTNDLPAGSCLGLLEKRTTANAGQLPVDVTYVIRWPDAPVLQIGETLIRRKRGLPDVFNFASAEIIWDSSNPTINLTGTNLLSSVVRLFDPVGSRVLKVPELAGLSRPGAQFELPSGLHTHLENGKVVFDDLPPDIGERLTYDPLNKWFTFTGVFDELRTSGEPFYLLNILTERERERIKDLDGQTGSTTDWDKIFDALYDLSRNPNGIDVSPRDGQPDRALRVGFTTNDAGQVVLEQLPETKALTAAIGDAPPPLPAPGGALSFDGNDFLNGGDAVTLAGGSFALEFWVKRGSLGGQQSVVGQGTAEPFAGMEAGFRSDNRFVFSFGETGTDTPLVTAESVTDTDWHHWAVTFNGTTRERVIYRDGIALASDTAAAVYAGGGPFWIGRGITGGFFRGQLDDVRIWDQVRTGFTVAKDRAKRLLGTESGLVRYYRFDEQTVSALDSSENATPAIIAGATRVPSTAPTGIPPRYVTVAENSDEELELPVSLHVIRIDDGPFAGQLNDIAPPNVFSEKISVRHSSDFGAEPERLTFEWWYKPDDGTVDPTELPVVDPVSGDVIDPRGWLIFTAYTPADGRGVNYVTLGDGGQSSLLTLGDNWFVMRYRGFNVNGAVPWSDWSGDPAGGAEPRAKLVEGWIKRVVRGLNPFDQRVADFHSEANTFASMLIQAGRRYEGDVAFNPDAGSINSIGLIEAYETVLRRGKRLSIDGTPAVNFGPANNALLLVASRIADLYVLLGNEAYADASDPTIGFGTGNGEYGSAITSIFAFQNQLDSSLEEELVLLRGRDDSRAGVGASPVYNRLFWNFTLGDGEVAYQQAFNINDFNTDGFIDEKDARIMFPQGHGDAWGHYLTAIKTWYALLRHPNFTWVPRAENVLVNGVAVQVDYTDERKFARTAAARAKTGSEIAGLTYRFNYVDDPSGQWQGYQDTNPDRAWGVTEWSRRAAQGALFDWMVANAILPAVDPNTNHTGITKIDRTTVRELDEVASHLSEIQLRLDQSDRGLNPLGLAKGVVPFDIDPMLVEDRLFGASHFGQIRDRALKAMNNAVKVWDEANKFTSLLRRNQDDADEFIPNVRDQEIVFRNQLIEIFGYPYAGDIGPGRTYPSAYEGPDLYHYMYVETAELTGENAPASAQFTSFFKPIEDGDTAHVFFPGSDRKYDANTVETSVLPVSYPQVAGSYTFTAPAAWGQRRAPGELQESLAEIVQEHAKLKQAMLDYHGLIQDIEDAIALLEAQHHINDHEITVLSAKLGVITTLNFTIAALKGTEIVLRRVADEVEDTNFAIMEALPKSAGLATDPSFALRGQLKAAENIATTVLESTADGLEVAENFVEAGKDTVELATELDLAVASGEFEVLQRVKEVEGKLRDEPAKRLEVFNQREALVQAMGRYRATLAKGERTLNELMLFRKRTAAATAEQRYEDMTFRIFRNDALQKYRAAYDLAARYVYLAAAAYDYEMNFLGQDARSGNEFLTDIIRQRSLGQMINGEPVVGLKGLADPLGRLMANYDVLKPQFGLNNPQSQDARFSLRHELYRIGAEGERESDSRWREQLQRARVENLWNVPEFRRYCRPFAPESAGAQPALVLRFSTTVTFGLNFFGWPLGPGDSAYDPSQFATKISRVGVWFSGADGGQIAATPRVYLVPIGMDVLRSPTGSDLATREWRVRDQVIPIPFPIGASSLSDPNWNPTFDSISGDFVQVRRYGSFPAYHDAGIYNQAQTTSDSRLIGRSAWNTEWLLIIPGGSLLSEPDAGLDAFLNSVSDVKLYFQTYSYAGN